jgi:multidrug transporter EmrE-like cation transporter
VDVKSVMAIGLFSLYTGCSAAGLLLFKHSWPRMAQSVSTGQLWTSAAIMPVIGAVLYIASFLIWLVIASRVPLTVAYPVAIGLSLVAVTLGAVVWLGEPLTAVRLLGSALVLSGVAVIVR